MKKTLFLLFTLITLSSCNNSLYTYEEVQNIFKKNRNDFEVIKDFLIINGEKYSFASIIQSNEEFQLVLSDHGTQTKKEIKNPKIKESLTSLINHKKISIIKHNSLVIFLLSGNKVHGIENASGIFFSKKEANILAKFPSYIKNHTEKTMVKNWYYYRY